MICSACNTPQDADAKFCTSCGASLVTAGKNRNAYGYALLLLPVILVACAIGYYKFFLPHGVAAVVNGEEITRADLEQAVSRTSSVNEADPRQRYQILNELIMERAMLQEARRAGTDVSAAELAAAVEDIRARSGLDADHFNFQAESQYGNLKRFEDSVKNRMIINRFLTSHIIPQGSDDQAARLAVDRWSRKITDSAVVRVTLAEEWSGAGCACAHKKSADRPSAGGCMMSRSGCRMAKNETASSDRATAAAASNKEQAAEAGLRYWHEKHGGKETVMARVTDFGCHMQVDIVENGKTIGSLRYQGGSISE